MDFATLPPEINSARMYSGPGSRSMMSAAAAWDELGAQLCDIAADYNSVASALAQRCRGPTATAMTQAMARHVEWLKALAAQAARAAAQARAAASAYEAALAAMVPPAAIDDNRAQRGSLVATNPLGQFAPAIADSEAEYERLWVRDAHALYTYAGAATEASKVSLFTSPPTGAGPSRRPAPAHNWSLTAAADVISTGHQLMSVIPRALQELSSTTLTTFDALLLPVTAALSKLSALSAPSGPAISHLNARNRAAALRSLFPKPSRRSGQAFTAGFDRGTSIGLLSVPRAWASTAPEPVAAERKRCRVCEPIRLVEPGEPPVSPSSG